jgi:hypothetical protein
VGLDFSRSQGLIMQTAAVAAATKKINLCEKFKFNNFLCITTLMSMVTSKSVFSVRIHRTTKMSIKF